MKKICILLILVLLTANLFAAGNQEATKEEVVLTMGSWRADDVEQMNNLLAVYKELVPNVTIDFKPTNPADYNATLRLQLDSGTGPDLMYARSYEAGQELFKAGHFADCTDIPGVKENFPASSLAPWQMPTGEAFAVPFAAVSHMVYFNQDLFKEAGVNIPKTWEEFLVVCNKLEAKGILPLANGIADEWDILECFFLGMLPNYIGGAEERIKYENGEKKFNDAAFIEAYQAMADVAQYCPDGFESVTYNDSQVLFATGQAAMVIDGSWTLGVYADVPFDWTVFAIPAPEGNAAGITFHPDMAITMNANTAHPEEAKAFLAWIATAEGATEASKELPTGYYPMIDAQITIANKQANDTLALNVGKFTDARFVWPKLMSLYAPMNQAVMNVMKGDMTAEEAANSIQDLM